MTNYTKTTDFAAKDSLPSGNAAKIVKGSEIDTEFNNIATASATKANANNAVLTGTTTAQTLDISGNVDVDGTLETDALSLNGVTVTSTAAELNYVDGVTSNIQTQLDAKAPLASPTFTGTVTVPGLTTTANVLFGDNDKAIFGAGSDLQIYHDGLNSYIVDAGTGDLYFRSASNLYIGNAAGTQSYITATDGGAVDLRYNGSAKLATTNTGIDVTGSVVSDGLTVDGNAVINNGTNATLQLQATGGNAYQLRTDVNDVFIYNATGARPLAKFAFGGDVSFYEDTGTTPKFFWDASTERLGLSTTSPSVALDVQASSGASRINVGTGSVAGDHGVNVVSGGANNDYGVFFNGSMALGSNTTTGAQLKIGSNGSETTFQTLTFHTNASERFRIDSSGNATVKAAGELRIRDDGTFIKENQGLQIGNTSGTGTTRPIRFFTESAERMRIDSSGQLLIGCTGQTGDAPNSDGFLFQQIGNLKIRVNSDGQVCQQYYSPTGGTSGPVGSITVNASSTAFNTSSDQRLKENIADADDAGSRVDAIQVRQFDWITNGSHQDYGMIAQELQTVAPEAVSGDADSEEMMAVDYSKLVPMLVKEIQSLRARVAQLENN